MNELYHYGRKGMKWGQNIFGKNRYQNSDGSLTRHGELRAERDQRGMSNNKKKQYKADPDKWVKEDMERSKRLVDASSNMANQLKSANEHSIRNKPKKQMDLSKMSDKEMRDKINRAFLEKQYDDMFNPQTTSRGREYASRILESAGTALTLTGSALSIALAIKELKG